MIPGRREGLFNCWAFILSLSNYLKCVWVVTGLSSIFVSHTNQTGGDLVSTWSQIIFSYLGC